MLKVTGITVDGREIVLENLIKIRLEKSLWVPAHSLQGEFFWEMAQEEMKYLKVSADGKIVFHGPVDEQALSCTAQGTVLSVSARSRAAYLLDNEAIPRIYDRPSFEDICSIHCKPYGFQKYLGTGRCPAKFQVSKGMTEWDVLDRFCRSVMGKRVRITDDDVIDASGGMEPERIIISNHIPGGLRFSSAKAGYKRYGVVSEIQYKLNSGEDYTYFIKNEDAQRQGINARRLVNLGGVPDWMNGALTQGKLEDSTRERFTVTAVLPEILLAQVGMGAAFLDPVLGEYRDLMVSAVSCKIDAKDASTSVTLHPKNILSGGNN